MQGVSPPPQCINKGVGMLLKSYDLAFVYPDAATRIDFLDSHQPLASRGHAEKALLKAPWLQIRLATEASVNSLLYLQGILKPLCLCPTSGRKKYHPITLICIILHWRLLSANSAVICMALGLSYVRYFCLSSPRFYCMSSQ